MEELSAHIGKEKLPSIINDPFKKNRITSIIVNYSPNIFNREKWDATGYVDFQNGSTSGQQKFKTPDFDSCVIQIREFINSLEK